MMEQELLSVEQANDLLQSLVGLPISKPWKGYGSAVFFELGPLTDEPGHKKSQGQSCINLNWDWRVEGPTQILFGSSNTGPKISDGLSDLLECKIVELTLSGNLPELHARTSSDLRIISASMTAGDPQWNIRLNSESWMECQNGKIHVGSGMPRGMSLEEQEASKHSGIVAKRWQSHTTKSKRGRCINCVYYTRLDGNFDLLDYGACTSAESPFDRTVVNRASGCNAFQVTKS